MEARVAKKSGEQRDTAHPGWGGGVGVNAGIFKKICLVC